MVHGMRLKQPNASLRCLAGQREKMQVKTPFGLTAGLASSVANLLDKRLPRERET